jgi:hypothetical protein
MPLCAKCNQNEAAIHMRTVVGGAEVETVHLCKDCAPPGFNNLDLKGLEALSVIGKKCEFCGREAFSGVTGSRNTIYWCSDCGLEFVQIVTHLLASERPDLMERSKEDSSFLSICFDPELQALAAAANQKAAQILKDRRQKDGRDEGGTR